MNYLWVFNARPENVLSQRARWKWASTSIIFSISFCVRPLVYCFSTLAWFAILICAGCVILLLRCKRFSHWKHAHGWWNETEKKATTNLESISLFAAIAVVQRMNLMKMYIHSSDYCLFIHSSITYALFIDILHQKKLWLFQAI